MGRRSLEDEQLLDEMSAHLKADIVDTEPDSQVAAFYAGRSVFITGATGFIGKVLTEKLLRSCPDIRRIYLLVRDRRNQSASDRLTALREMQLFSRLSSRPGGRELLEQKLRLVEGDITLPLLGVAPADLERLADEVSVVFNSAATVRFEEPLDVAARNNIQSVGELVHFCNRLHKLQALVHLSTAYSNCHKSDQIHEILYEPPISGDHLLQALQELQRIQSETRAPPLLPEGGGAADGETTGRSRDACRQHRFHDRPAPADGHPSDLVGAFGRLLLRLSNRPNTYTLTKAVAEAHLVDRLRASPNRYGPAQVPVALVRPSIVTGAWREPVAGYVDNSNGCTGALLCISAGTLRAFPARPDGVADLVPVDMVANLLICTGWFLAGARSQRAAGARQPQVDSGIYLFNMVSGRRNPIRWRPLTDRVRRLALEYPMEALARWPSFVCLDNVRLYEWFDLLNHKLPAYLMDLWMRWCLGRQLEPKSSALAAYGRLKQLQSALVPFALRQWLIDDSNVCALYANLSEPDRRLFPFDVALIDWRQYIRDYMLSARVIVLKDSLRGVAGARRRWKRRQHVYRASLTLLLLVAYYLFVHQSQLESALAGWLLQLAGGGF